MSITINANTAVFDDLVYKGEDRQKIHFPMQKVKTEDLESIRTHIGELACKRIESLFNGMMPEDIKENIYVYYDETVLYGDKNDLRYGSGAFLRFQVEIGDDAENWLSSFARDWYDDLVLYANNLFANVYADNTDADVVAMLSFVLTDYYGEYDLEEANGLFEDDVARYVESLYD